jgi:transposase
LFESNDLTVLELTNILREKYGRTFSRQTVENHILEAGITWKAKIQIPRAWNEEDVLTDRMKFVQVLGSLIGKDLAFLDESPSSVAERRSKGRAQKGFPVVELCPAMRQENVTLLVTLLYPDVANSSSASGTSTGTSARLVHPVTMRSGRPRPPATKAIQAQAAASAKTDAEPPADPGPGPGPSEGQPTSEPELASEFESPSESQRRSREDRPEDSPASHPTQGLGSDSPGERKSSEPAEQKSKSRRRSGRRMKLSSRGVTSDAFIQYLEELKTELPEGCTIIMDNAQIHKTKEVKKWFEQSSFDLLYLPRYSPFLNPVEYLFHSVKEYVRTKAREKEGVLQSMDDLEGLLLEGEVDVFDQSRISSHVSLTIVIVPLP